MIIIAQQHFVHEQQVFDQQSVLDEQREWVEFLLVILFIVLFLNFQRRGL